MEAYINILAFIVCVVILLTVYTTGRVYFVLWSCFTMSFENEKYLLPNGYSKVKFINSIILVVLHVGITYLLIDKFIYRESNVFLLSSFMIAFVIFHYVIVKLIECNLPLRISEYFKGFKLLKLFKHKFFLLDFSDNKTTNSSESIVSENELENIKSSIIEEIVKIKNPYIRSDRNVSNSNLEEVCNDFGIDINCKEVVKDKISGVETPKKIVFTGINHKGFEKEPVVYFFIKHFNIVDSYKNGKIKYVNNSQKDVLEFINDNIYFENSQAKDKFKRELSDSDFSKYVKKYFKALGK